MIKVKIPRETWHKVWKSLLQEGTRHASVKGLYLSDFRSAPTNTKGKKTSI